MLKLLLDILGWVGTALVAGAVGLRFIRPELQSVWRGLAIAGLTCVLLYMATQWREIARLFTKREARLGSLSVTSILLVLAILVGINYIASRQNTRWDLTAAQQFSLSDQTRRVLEGLTAPVQILVFGRDGDFERFRDRLNEFEYVSRLVSVEYIDIDRQPTRARQYQIQSYGTVVFEYDGRTERVVGDTEQQFVNALNQVIIGEERTVYFVTGHGEKDLVSAERTGYNAIQSALTGENFSVEPLVLAQLGEVPADATLVVIAGPRTDYLAGEVDALRRYLDRGGKLLALIDPPDEAGGDQFPNLAALLREWAIELGHDVVVDVSGVGQLIGTDASVPVAAPPYPGHPITERFTLLTAYPLARSVSAMPGGVDDRFAQVFIETSPRSWAETDIDGLLSGGEVEFEEDRGDRIGPISIGVAVAAPVPGANGSDDLTPDEADTDGESEPGDVPPPPETRVVVVGDSDFASNAALGIQGNRDLFLNMVNWLAEHEDMIAVRPRDPEDRRITMTADQQRWLFLLAIFVVPGVILSAGVYSWWRRR